jgi:hypothetical protein
VIESMRSLDLILIYAQSFYHWTRPCQYLAINLFAEHVLTSTFRLLQNAHFWANPVG